MDLYTSKPFTLNLFHYAGDTFPIALRISVAGVAFNFDSYKGKMQIRKKPDDTTPILEIGNDCFTFTTGRIAIEKSAELMAIPKGTYYYDIELTDANNRVKTWFAGTFTISRDITRA